MSLTEVIAKERSVLIKQGSIHYNLNIYLRKGDYYSGVSELYFSLNSKAQELLIDYKPNYKEGNNGIKRVTVNGRVLESSQYTIDDIFLRIPSQFLISEELQNEHHQKLPEHDHHHRRHHHRPKHSHKHEEDSKPLDQEIIHSVIVEYESKYSVDGSGCSTYTDVDQKKSQYLYTQYEAYDANQVFPCFDQPDLKATLRFSVIYPNDWSILTNEYAQKTQPFNLLNYIDSVHPFNKTHLEALATGASHENDNFSIYPQTKLLPTYLFGFVAGSYAGISADKYKHANQYKELLERVPMSIYSISSYVGYLQKLKDFIFDVTIQAMKFYEEFFGVPYPFNKYDQVWVHEFKAGAMENAGIVTYNDARTLYKEAATSTQMFQLANTITHELSHHWFGNYVTMKWWDDLWLNESFADYISHLCLQRIQLQTYHFTSPLATFIDRKAWGYQEDERNSTTHAIRAPVPNTGVADSIFDGITYSKGAAVLKQLHFLVGDQKFSRSLKHYFTDFAWKNATIDDFLGHIDFEGQPLEITTWRQQWLQRASLNSLTPSWNPDSTDPQSVLRISQSVYNNQNPDHHTLRFHKIKVAFFSQNLKEKPHVEDVLLRDQEVTEVVYDGSKHYKAILLNYEDHTFAQVIPDVVSRDFLLKHINQINNQDEDLLTRTLIWYNLLQLLRNALFRVDDFTEVVLTHLFNQKESSLLQGVFKNLLINIQTQIPRESRTSLTTKIYHKIVEVLPTINPNHESDRALVLKDQLVAFSRTQEQILYLIRWFNGEVQHQNPITVGEKWNTIQLYFTLRNVSNAEKWALFDRQASEPDGESWAAGYRPKVTPLIATREQYEEYYNAFKNPQNPDSVTLKKLKALGWISEVHYDWLFNDYRQRYFDDIITLSEVLKGNNFSFFYQDLRPIDDLLEDQINKFGLIIPQFQNKNGLSQHYIALKKRTDDLGRRLRNYNFNAKYQQGVDSDSTLTQIRAQRRYEIVRQESIHYNFHLSLQEGQNYTGFTQIQFQLLHLPKNILEIDFKGDAREVLVNGEKVETNASEGFEYLKISKSHLKLGVNKVAVVYRNKYDNDAYGCISSLNEGKQYLYTTFEPHSAHRVFPVFDQPDLKATFNFFIIVPDHWVAVSNEPHSHQDFLDLSSYETHTSVDHNHKALVNRYLEDQKGKLLVFPKNRRISTYLFSFIAGEYFEIALPVEKRHNNIPMSLYALDSYKDVLDNHKDFIFQIALESLKFFQTNFGYEYPFSKYDQVFAHEYKMGAMENPGLVTFNDNYLYPDKVSTETMLSFANTIAHECSHMWFGDLVTMKWWDDLWLNESFADFISHFFLEKKAKGGLKSINYQSGFAAFVERKVRGYKEDQMTTTHPIRGLVPNTSMAESIFDGITYCKGGSSLKQLVYLMGEENFFAGLKEYFHAYAWKNGTIAEFLGTLNKHFNVAGVDLQGNWRKTWLQTASLNTFDVNWNPANHGEQAVLKITQGNYSSDPKLQQLRVHKLKIAFFKQDFTYDVVEHLFPAVAETIIHYDCTKNYKAVLLNYEDQGFIKFPFDKFSLDYFVKNVTHIKDLLTRLVIWHYLNELVRDAALKVSQFVDIALNNVFNDPSDRVLDFVFKFLVESLQYIPIRERGGQARKIFEAVHNYLSHSNPNAQNSNRVSILKDQLINFAVVEEDILTIHRWRRGEETSLGSHIINKSQSWAAIKKYFSLSSVSTATKQEAFRQQEAIDKSQRSRLARLTCDALIANGAQFEEIFQLFLQTNESVSNKSARAAGWNHQFHLDLLAPQYKAHFFSKLNDSLAQRIGSGEHFACYLTQLAPIDDNLEESVQLYEQVRLTTGGDLDKHITTIRKSIDNLKRRIRTYALNANN